MTVRALWDAGSPQTPAGFVSWGEEVSDVADAALPKAGGTMTGRVTLKDYAETRTAPAVTAGALTLDLTTGNVFEVSLTANVTSLTISNPPASGTACSFTMILKQDATGSRTVTWPASVKWAGGTAPTLTTTASKTDILSFLTTDAGTTWYGFVGGKNF